MMIGGRDYALSVPAGVPAGEVFLRLCRTRWPDGVFQDADSDVLHPLSDPLVFSSGANGHEFFVFKTRRLAETWEETGPTSENVNHFLHFLAGPSRDGPYEVTVVYDEMNEWMTDFFRELQAAIHEAANRLNSQGGL
jgi:hypothetical protein